MKDTSPSFRSSAGFTLAEVLVAIAIVAMMGFLLYLSTDQVLRSQARTELREEYRHAVYVSLDRLKKDLYNAYIVRQPELLPPDFNGEIYFLGDTERLDFASRVHERWMAERPEDEGVELSYYLENDPENPEFKLLMRRQATEVDADLSAGGIAYPLLNRVSGLKFSFFPIDGNIEMNEWKRNWDSRSAESGQRLPRRLRIELSVVFPEDTEPKTYQADLIVYRVDALLL